MSSGFRRLSLFAACLCISVFSGAWVQDALAGPQAVFENGLARNEAVHEGETAVFTFAVRNGGDEDLEITAVKPACGCTTADFDRQIPPGREGEITLALSTKGYEGSVAKTARVFTNDPTHREVRLTIQADIQVPISVTPKHVLLKAKNGESVSQSIEIKAELPRPLTLELSDSGLKDRVSYTVKEMQKGRAFSVLLTSRGGSAAGAIGTLVIRTNYPERPEIRVPIRVRGNKPEATASQPGETGPRRSNP